MMRLHPCASDLKRHGHEVDAQFMMIVLVTISYWIMLVHLNIDPSMELQALR
jgi:hypothetical protein